MDSKRCAAVGVFVLIGLICVAYMTIKLGKMEVFSDKGFELKASFTNVSGAWARTLKWPACPWARWLP